LTAISRTIIAVKLNAYTIIILYESRNRAAGQVVTPAKLGKRFLAIIAAIDRLALLVVRELRLAPSAGITVACP
jgi:hypothetical protein